jgi:hypothetical protein
MTKNQDFYDWYNEEVEPLISQLKERMAKKNENMEYVFVISEPKPNMSEVPTMTDYSCKECGLPYYLVEVIESQMGEVSSDSSTTLN